MLDNLPILSMITFIPLIGALMLMVISRVAKDEGREQIEKNAPTVALWVSFVVFVLSLMMVLSFDRTSADYQFVENAAWIGDGIRYRMGVDGISVLFVLLTTFLTPLCILGSMTSIKFQNRIYASYKFFLYTLLGSVLMLAAILAGILLKLGGYGLLRFSIPLFPNASLSLAPLVFWMSIIAIIVTSLIAYRQNDMKKLIAYSSVAHMGFVTMGIFAMNVQGVQGSIFQMLSHGVVSGALFFCVGVVYDRMHTREISFYGGLAKQMPVFAALFMLFTMANVGLPGTSGFVGEILTMIGAYQVSPWIAFGAAFGMILSAMYALHLFREVVFGEVVNEKLVGILDVTKREAFILSLLAVMTLVLGVYPSLVTDITAVSVDNLIANYNTAIAAASGN